MIKESLDPLEAKLGQRKKFLLDDNLEKLQEEFLKNKEKCCSKIVKKEKPKEDNAQSNINNNFTFPSGEVKKKKGKKKIKDVITLNLPPLNPAINENINSKPISQSLFSLSFEENKNKSKNDTINVNLITGLPETFKINEKINKGQQNKNEEEKVGINIDNESKSHHLSKIKKEENVKEEFHSKEYDEINNENEKKIEQMSEEEILAAQKEIFASIPSDLIEKFKSNFFSQQIKKSLNKKDNNLLNDKKNEFEKETLQKEEINKEEKSAKDKIENNVSGLNINKEKNQKEGGKDKEEIVLFSYDGKIKKENKSIYKLNNQ